MTAMETAIQEEALQRYRPYPAYKASGVEWLGEIPEHWEVKPLKAIGALQTGLTLGKEYQGSSLVTRPYLRVANVQDGYLSLDDVAEIKLPEREAPRYELCRGDVLMTEGGDYDKLGRGCVWENQVPQCLHQNHIFAVRPRLRQLSPEFLSLAMGSSYGRAYFTATSKQSTNLASTNSTKLRNFPLPLPGKSEQHAITTFLNQETARIDALVARKQRLIELLQERRTALITRAVTKGLDPSVPMMDSEVEWLGDIPEHWEVAKTWRLFSAISGGTPAKDEAAYWEGEIPWVSPKDMKRRFIETSEDMITELALAETGVKLIPNPSILVVVRGMILAHAFPVAITTAPVTINQDMKALRLRPNVAHSFIAWLFEGIGSALLGVVVEEAAHGTKVIRMDKWHSVELPVPPIDEQPVIAKHLDRETLQIDKLISRVRDAIKRLEELRTALISAAITGKIDLREEVV